MIKYYQNKVKELEKQIALLKSEEIYQLQKFEELIDNFSDITIDMWNFDFDLKKKNQMVSYSRWPYPELKENKSFAFSKNFISEMNDFFLIELERYDYHKRYSDYDYLLFPFLEWNNFIVFADFKFISINEYDWYEAKKSNKGLEKIIKIIKDKNISDKLIEKFLKASGLQEIRNKENLNELLDLYYSSL